MASIGIVGPVITFIGDAGNEAVARSQVTTTDEDTLVSFSFTVGRQPLILRIGTTAGGQDIVADTALLPGFHLVSVTPGATTYYVEFVLRAVGTATLTNFIRVAPGVMEITSPYSAAAFPSVRKTQSLNTIFFAGGGQEMHVLERRGQNSWSLRPYMQIDGPFAPINLSRVTLTPAARTGTTTLTSSTPLFRTVDVGSLLRLTHSGQFQTSTLSAVDDLTDSIRVTGVETSRIFQLSLSGTWVGTVLLERSIGNEFSFATFASYTTNQAISIDDDLDNQVVFYRLRMSAYSSGAAIAGLTYGSGVTDGVARIVTVDADNQVTVDVMTAFGQAAATTLWSFGEWSGRFGQPTAVALFDGRLWVGRGNAYWGSASDDFSSFDVGPLANQAISRTFGGRMSSVRWLAGAGRLVAGLSGFEAEISSNAFEEVLKPDNVKSRGATTRGSLDADPMVVDDAAVFISRTGERLYRFGYTAQEGAFGTEDLTRLHREIGGADGFVSLAYQVEPEPRIWAVRADGECACLVYDRSEGVVAWCRLVTDGYVESVTCLPGTPEDEVYFVVRRTVNGNTVRYIERLAAQYFTSLEACNRLHSTLAYSGVSTSTLTGLSHLEARTDVYVWGNGRISGPYTVTSGSITLNYAVTYAVVGLKYDGLYKSAKLNYGGDNGSVIGSEKQLSRLAVMFYQTAGGCFEWGDSFDDMSVLADIQSESGFTFDTAVQLWSGEDDFHLEGATQMDTRLHIRMSGAGPVTVLGVAPTLSTNG
jgi:hypothetical protein